MKKIIILCLLAIGFGATAQEKSTVTELGDFCYVDSLSTKLVFNEKCTVTKKLNFVSVKFRSKYAFSLQDDKSKDIYNIVEKSAGLGKETQRKKLGEIPAVFLEGLTKTKNAANNGYEIANGMNQPVEVYYHLGDLVLIFPKLTFKGLVSPSHRVYIPNDCVSDFKNIFK
jgi:hypothetical protein